jgi:hypothetical protein
MGIAEGHGRRRMPQEVGHRGEGNTAHHEHGRKRMSEIMEVEAGQASALTGRSKEVPGLLVASSLCIMEHPRQVLPSP